MRPCRPSIARRRPLLYTSTGDCGSKETDDCRTATRIATGRFPTPQLQQRGALTASQPARRPGAGCVATGWAGSGSRRLIGGRPGCVGWDSAVACGTDQAGAPGGSGAGDCGRWVVRRIRAPRPANPALPYYAATAPRCPGLAGQLGRNIPRPRNPPPVPGARNEPRAGKPSNARATALRHEAQKNATAGARGRPLTVPSRSSTIAV
jgi:hypothetical protein